MAVSSRTLKASLSFCLGFLLPLFVAFWVIIAFTQGDERMCAGCCCLGTNFLVWALILFSSGTDYHAALGRLPRTVRLVGGELVVETPSHQWSIPLAECDWFPSYTDANRETCFLPRKPAIIVVHLNQGHTCRLASHRRCIESGMPFSHYLGSRTVGDFPGFDLS